MRKRRHASSPSQCMNAHCRIVSIPNRWAERRLPSEITILRNQPSQSSERAEPGPIEPSASLNVPSLLLILRPQLAPLSSWTGMLS
mmetsp:Transcript_20460/g.33167  ORF Transcript_20460/g.33167 Transcript_20460/m.33167 type:complete len:86 (-) Transcript_20460:198-455(-)